MADFQQIFTVQVRDASNPDRKIFRISEHDAKGNISSVWEQERYIVNAERDTERENVNHAVAEFFEFLFPMTAAEEKAFMESFGRNSVCPECNEELENEDLGECPECGAVFS